MLIPPWMLALSVGILLYLLKTIYKQKVKIKDNSYIEYVDTSGIQANPPRFEELMKGVTINFDLDGEKISIPQVSITGGLSIIKKIRESYELIDVLVSQETLSAKDELKKNVSIVNTQNYITLLIYNLSKPFVKNKKNYKKRLFKKSVEDNEFIINICLQCMDYWRYVGKLRAILVVGGSLRAMYGGNAMLNYHKWDTGGKIEIKPRYVLPTNSSNKKTKHQEKC